MLQPLVSILGVELDQLLNIWNPNKATERRLGHHPQYCHFDHEDKRNQDRTLILISLEVFLAIVKDC